MGHLLYHKKTRPTGRKLAKSLGLIGTIEVPGNSEVLIRWGNARPTDVGRAGLILNKAQAISHAGDKLLTLRTLKDAGIPIPQFSTDHAELDGIVLGRKRRGFGGKDIAV